MKKIYLLTSVAFIAGLIFIIHGCSKKAEMPSTGATTQHYDTITSLANMHSNTAIWFHDGEYTLVTIEPGDEEKEESEPYKSLSATCSDSYAGSARAAAKTSFASVSYTTYASVTALRATLQTDAFMQSLGLTNSSNRSTYEKRNVIITTAYLFAISRESDNDYHMIIGDASGASANILNSEGSGLPASSASSYTAIKAVRDAIKAKFGTDFCTTTGYTHFSPAIKLTTLKASMFYDIDHAPGTVGPSSNRPNTSWEMHPINTIAF